MLMSLRRAFFIISASLALLISGCGGSGVNANLPPDPLVQFFNCSPDSVPLTFGFDDDIVANGLGYLGSTPGFAERIPGEQDVYALPTAGGDIIWSEVTSLERDKSYIILAYGLQNFGTETEKRLRIAILTTNRTAPNNSARIIILHAYNRKPGFDTPLVDFQNPGQNPQYKQEGITFGNRVELTVNAGSYTFVARRTNTEDEITPQVTKNFEAGKIYFAVISGIEEGAGALAPKISFFDVPAKD